MIGGTGVLSSATGARLVELGHDVTAITRGQSARPLPEGVRGLVADVAAKGALAAAVAGERWDAAIDFIAYTRDDVQRDIEVLNGRVGHYVFISSASVYQPRPMRIPLTESTPLGNPYWSYPAAKLEAEALVRSAYLESGFPGTVVRPAQTYDHTRWQTLGGWTDVLRMREGSPLLVHGDGTSVRSLTHSSDFARGLVGILGNPLAINDSFHITSEELLTWNDIYELVASAVGGTADLVHVSSQSIVAADPSKQGTLLGDRAHSKIFNNDKLRTLVPGFRYEVPYAQGVREVLAHWDSLENVPARDAAFDALTDRLVAFARSIAD